MYYCLDYKAGAYCKFENLNSKGSYLPDTMLTVVAKVFSNTFDNVSSFCKLLIFFSKNRKIVLAIFQDRNFNAMLANNVKF